MTPMVERLDASDQQHVNDAWVSALTPPDRLDHTLLLDVLIMYRFYERGVDRLHLRSEKDVNGRQVVMEIEFDRQRPELDAFTFTYIDATGIELRRERYSRAEVYDRVAALTSGPHSTTQPGELDALEQREREIVAATQPAGAPAPNDTPGHAPETTRTTPE